MKLSTIVVLSACISLGQFCGAQQTPSLQENLNKAAAYLAKVEIRCDMEQCRQAIEAAREDALAGRAALMNGTLKGAELTAWRIQYRRDLRLADRNLFAVAARHGEYNVAKWDAIIAKGAADRNEMPRLIRVGRPMMVNCNDLAAMLGAVCGIYAAGGAPSTAAVCGAFVVYEWTQCGSGSMGINWSQAQTGEGSTWCPDGDACDSFSNDPEDDNGIESNTTDSQDPQPPLW